jgi:hypothetical protein
MNIIKTTITATASLHYEQASMSIEATDVSVDDLKNLEGVTIAESVKMVKDICDKVGAIPAPDERPSVQVHAQYGTDAAPHSFKKDPGYPASPNQIKFLQDKGYQGPTEGLTKMQASNILEQMGFGRKNNGGKLGF